MTAMHGIDWQSFGTVAAFLAGWGGLLLWAVKFMLDRQAKHIDERFAEMAEKRDGDTTRVNDLERELLELKAELPREYVRREDAIRQETVFHHKLDALAGKIDQLGTRWPQ